MYNRFLQIIFAFGILSLLSATLAYSQDKDGQRSNILFVIADDWSYPHASVYGDAVVKTPNFDRVAKNGVLFTNAYCVAPSCTPSRAGILTGLYPHRLQEGPIYGVFYQVISLYILIYWKKQAMP